MQRIPHEQRVTVAVAATAAVAAFTVEREAQSSIIYMVRPTHAGGSSCSAHNKTMAFYIGHAAIIHVYTHTHARARIDIYIVQFVVCATPSRPL